MVLCAKAAPGTAKAKEKKKKRQKTAGWSVARGNGVEVEDRGRRGRAVGGCSGKGGGNPLSLSGGGGLRAGISDFGREGRAHCLRSALGRGLRATLTGAPHSGISETYWRAKAASHSFLFRSLAAPGFAAVARLDNLKSPSRPIPPRNLPLAAPFQRRNC